MSERLFVCVDLPERFGPDIESIQERLGTASGIRPTDPSSVHVTLAFVGEVPTERVDTVREAVATGVDRAALEPVDVEYRGLGVFPSREYITVVWIGVGEGGAELTRLHRSLVGALEDAGVEVETHETFTPHATIARMDHGGGKEHVQGVLEEATPKLGRDRVETVHLKRSLLGADGPTYEPIADYSLG